MTRCFVLVQHDYEDTEVVSVHRTLDGARLKAGDALTDRYETYTNNCPPGCFSRTYTRLGLVAYEFDLQE